MNIHPDFYKVTKKTPLQKAHKLSQEAGCSVYLKREDLQPVHSFKIRGAFNKISWLSEEEKRKGVITASAGNHAQGVALSAKHLGLVATIVMPKTTPKIKVDAVKSYGAEVILYGDNYSEAQQECDQITKKSHKSFIHPFDDDLVIAGQGTIATEILDELPDATHIFVCVGGGGMLAGIAEEAKRINPDIIVVSVEPEDSNAMQASINEGSRIELDHVGIFADGVAVKKVGEITFSKAQKYVDEFITVSIDEMCAAIKSIFEDTRSIVEPAGALAVAGLRSYNLPQQSKAVAICSGANMSFEKLQFIAERTLIGSNREALYSISLPEKPGALRTFCSQVLDNRSVTEFSYRLNKRNSAKFLVGISVANSDDKTELECKFLDNDIEFVDLTDDEVAKEHVRHMIGGVSPNARNEVFYNINFPERPRALYDFLNKIGESFNISLFHYRSVGGGIGQVMIGFEAENPEQVEKMVKSTGYDYKSTQSDTLDLFLL